MKMFKKFDYIDVALACFPTCRENSIALNTQQVAVHDS